MNLEKPSKASTEFGGSRQKRLLGSEAEELERLKTIKVEILGDGEKSISKKRTKGGPNPLSCKKKKKKNDDQPCDEPKSESENAKKRTRKRKRIKIAKHVKNLLDSHNVKLDGE